MRRLKFVFAVIGFLIGSLAFGQDPSFSQFFSSPLNVNPALTGNINGDWRVVSNFRDQWIGPASPYVTGTASYDQKVLQKKMPHIEEGNTMGVGVMLMHDYAMAGIVRSTYASANLSYGVKLSEGDIIQKLTAGFGAIYGHRTIDYSRLDFEEQFTGFGFNTNLPTGEVALSSMKPYFSSSVGLLYNIRSEKSNIDLGVSAFHINRPRQTWLKDENQRLEMRKVMHGNFETFLNDRLILNVNAIYQNQSRAKYFSAGGALSFYVNEENNAMLTTGLWYWSRNAIVPYVGLSYNNMQFGFSYDATISKLKSAARKPTTWELSLIIRGVRDNALGVIPCPWK